MHLSVHVVSVLAGLDCGKINCKYCKYLLGPLNETRVHVDEGGFFLGEWNFESSPWLHNFNLNYEV